MEKLSVLLAILFFLAPSLAFSLDIFNPFKNTAKVCVITIDGVIGDEITPDDFAEEINDAKEQGCKGIILKINSPGGSAPATHEIIRILRKFDGPKVAKIYDIATSGAYWIAASCDYIIADQLSIVGSIGSYTVLSSYSALLKRFNVTFYVIAVPENKSFGDPFNPIDLWEIKRAEEMANRTAEFFIKDVLSRRPQVRKYTTGLPYLAYEAPGLVDDFGGFEEAKEKIKELLGVDRIEVVNVEPEADVFKKIEKLLKMFKQTSLYANRFFQLV